MDIEALWLECGWRMHQLHAAAQFLQLKQCPRRDLLPLFRQMERLRAFVNENLLLCHDNADPMGVLHDTECLVEAVSKVFGWSSPTRESLEAERTTRLQQELDAVAILNNNALAKSTERDRLGELIQALRRREQSREFHRDLLLAVMKHSSQRTSEYSNDNFAYGSTPFDSWVCVCTSKSIQRARENWKRDTTQENPEGLSDPSSLVVSTPCVIVGSSTGSLVFFTSALLDVPCTGIEILPYLHTVAQDLQDQCQVPNCTFLLSDVLATALTSVQLVVLTSQCWDSILYKQILMKLERELGTKSLVVDYRNGLQAFPQFRLVEQLNGLRVSWNPMQSFFIYEHC